MKILHLSDLHIGKKLNGYSLIEDQRFVFESMYKVIKDKKVEVVIIAGDIYDRSIPSEEAVALLDDFFERLITDLKVKVVAISGNHDSSKRLDFSSGLLGKIGLHIVSEYHSLVNKISIDDIDFYLMPFIDPATLRRKHKSLLEDQDLKISTYDDTMEFITNKAVKKLDKSRINIAIYHGFVVGSLEDGTSDKEESVKSLSVGGKEAVRAIHFKDFDFTALGHLHGVRRVAGDKILYAGTPLKYSFSEVNQSKKFVILDITKDSFNIEEIDITPRFDMAEVRGTYDEIMALDINRDSYLKIILTEQIFDAMSKLKQRYTNIMELQVEIETTNRKNTNYSVSEISKKEPTELFTSLAESVGVELESSELEVFNEIVLEIGGER